MFYKARDGDGGSHVVDLDAVADVEGVVKEYEYAAVEEFVYCAADREAETNSQYGDGGLDLFNSWNI